MQIEFKTVQAGYQPVATDFNIHTDIDFSTAGAHEVELVEQNQTPSVLSTNAETGVLGAEALVTFLMSSVVYVIMPFEDNTSWFCIKCPLCLQTSSSRVRRWFPALIKGQTRVDIARR